MFLLTFSSFYLLILIVSSFSNCWADYNPHSNVLWLHYLADKLLTMRYRNKPHTSQQKALKSNLKSFHSEILNYHSAKDVLLHSTLFQWSPLILYWFVFNQCYQACLNTCKGHCKVKYIIICKKIWIGNKEEIFFVSVKTSSWVGFCHSSNK